MTKDFRALYIQTLKKTFAKKKGRKKSGFYVPRSSRKNFSSGFLAEKGDLKHLLREGATEAQKRLAAVHPRLEKKSRECRRITLLS